MLQATFLPLKPSVREGVSAKDGKPWRMVTQAGYVTFSDGRQESVNFRVRQDKKTGQDILTPPGTYSLDPASFYLMDGDLAFSPKWLPGKPASGEPK